MRERARNTYISLTEDKKTKNERLSKRISKKVL